LSASDNARRIKEKEPFGTAKSNKISVHNRGAPEKIEREKERKLAIAAGWAT